MWKKAAFGVLVLGILCVAIGFAVATAQTSFGTSSDATKHVSLTGDDGGSRKPFGYKLVGDEGGPGKPFRPINGTI